MVGIKTMPIWIYLGKLQYFTNLNSSAIWGWFPLLTLIYGEVEVVIIYPDLSEPKKDRLEDSHHGEPQSGSAMALSWDVALPVWGRAWRSCPGTQHTIRPERGVGPGWFGGQMEMRFQRQYRVKCWLNHGKSIGKWWFHGILSDSPSGKSV